MKKRALLLVLAWAAVACPEPHTDEQHAKREEQRRLYESALSEVRQITYVEDKATHVCFAFVGQARLLTNVPCNEAVLAAIRKSESERIRQ